MDGVWWLLMSRMSMTNTASGTRHLKQCASGCARWIRRAARSLICSLPVMEASTRAITSVLAIRDLVPAKSIDTAVAETASDDWFADFDGDGVSEMAVGRLPARTACGSCGNGHEDPRIRERERWPGCDTHFGLQRHLRLSRNEQQSQGLPSTINHSRHDRFRTDA